MESTEMFNIIKSNFTEDLYNKEYELYTNFIDSILESPINWSEYGVENPKCFEEISI